MYETDIMFLTPVENERNWLNCVLTLGCARKCSARVLSHIGCINIHVSVSPPGMLPGRRRQVTGSFRFLTMSHRAIKGRRSNIVVFCMRRKWLVIAFFSLLCYVIWIWFNLFIAFAILVIFSTMYISIEYNNITFMREREREIEYI